MIRLPVFGAPPVAAGEFDTEPEVCFPPVAIADPRGGAQSWGGQLDPIIESCLKFDGDAGALGTQVLEESRAGLAAVPDFHEVGAEMARASPALDGWLRLRSLGGGAAGGHIRGTRASGDELVYRLGYCVLTRAVSLGMKTRWKRRGAGILACEPASEPA